MNLKSVLKCVCCRLACKRHRYPLPYAPKKTPISPYLCASENTNIPFLIKSTAFHFRRMLMINSLKSKFDKEKTTLITWNNNRQRIKTKLRYESWAWNHYSWIIPKEYVACEENQKQSKLYLLKENKYNNNSYNSSHCENSLYA